MEFFISNYRFLDMCHRVSNGTLLKQAVNWAKQTFYQNFHTSMICLTEHSSADENVVSNSSNTILKTQLSYNSVKTFCKFDETLKKQLKETHYTYLPTKSDSFADYVNNSKALQTLLMFGVKLFSIEKNYKAALNFMVKLDVNKDIISKLQFLKKQGVTAKEFGPAITENPYILDPCKNIQDLEETVTYLKTKKFNSEQISSLLVRFPTIFNIPVVKLDGILGFYQRMPTNYENKSIVFSGPETREIVIRCPKLMAADLEAIFLRVKLMQLSFGFSVQQIRKIIQQRPQILLQDLKTLEQHYHFFVAVLNLTHEEICNNAFMFEVRLKLAESRHGYLKSIGRAQYCEEEQGYLSLFDVFSSAHNEFCKICDAGSLKEYERFLKTL